MERIAGHFGAVQKVGFVSVEGSGIANSLRGSFGTGCTVCRRCRYVYCSVRPMQGRCSMCGPLGIIFTTHGLAARRGGGDVASFWARNGSVSERGGPSLELFGREAALRSGASTRHEETRDAKNGQRTETVERLQRETQQMDDLLLLPKDLSSRDRFAKVAIRIAVAFLPADAPHDCLSILERVSKRPFWQHGDECRFSERMLWRIGRAVCTTEAMAHVHT